MLPRWRLKQGERRGGAGGGAGNQDHWGFQCRIAIYIVECAECAECDVMKLFYLYCLMQPFIAMVYL